MKELAGLPARVSMEAPVVLCVAVREVLEEPNRSFVEEKGTFVSSYALDVPSNMSFSHSLFSLYSSQTADQRTTHQPTDEELFVTF